MPSRGEIYSARQASPSDDSRRRAQKNPTQLSDAALKFAEESVDTAISTVVISGFARLIEFLLIALTGLVIQLVYVYPNEGFPAIYPVAILFGAVLFGAVLSVMGFQAIDIYSPHALRTIVRQNSKLLIAWVGVFAVMTLIAFFLKIGDNFSRVWLALWFAVGFVVLLAFRVGLAILVRHWTRTGRLERRAVIVGGGEPAEQLIRALEAPTTPTFAYAECSTTAATTGRRR